MTKVLSIGVIIIPMILMLGALTFNVLVNTESNASDLKVEVDGLYDQAKCVSNLRYDTNFFC